jgi:carboxypeptidase C (cathepsin A)
MRKILTIVALAVTCLNFQVQAQSTPIERPTLTKGDTWTYRTVDNWTDKELNQTEVVFADIENDLLVFRSTNKATNSISTNKNNADIQPCRSMQNDDKFICQGAFKFPMAIGNKHEIKKLPWGDGKGYNDADCEVKEPEKITTPAGTFDTLRIECSGFQTRVFEGIFNGSYKETLWYAPLVKRSVKSYFENRSNRGINTKQTTELVSYKVK